MSAPAVTEIALSNTNGKFSPDMFKIIAKIDAIVIGVSSDRLIAEASPDSWADASATP